MRKNIVTLSENVFFFSWETRNGGIILTREPEIIIVTSIYVPWAPRHICCDVYILPVGFKGLKYVFNIVLKLNNHTWKKVWNYFLGRKNDAQISGFVVGKKAPSPWKKIFSKKTILPAYLCRYDFQNSVRQLVWNKWVSRFLSFGDFKVPKNGSSQ